MTLELYTELRNPIAKRVNTYSEILNTFEKNSAGMVEITEEFRNAKNSYELAFNELRALNKFTPNNVKKAYSRANRGW